MIRGGGGQTNATFTPWIAFLDPDETESPQHGLYVVYIFSSDLRSVTLTLNQGVTRLEREFKRRGALTRLRENASNVRSILSPVELLRRDEDMAIGAVGWRQRAYLAGNIVAQRYSVDSFPTEEVLLADLRSFLSLYQDAAQSEFGLSSKRQVSHGGNQPAVQDPAEGFDPNSEHDYVVFIESHRQVKSRRHEVVINQYRDWATEEGFRVSNQEYPRDLILRSPNQEWLIEVKVVYGGRTMEAARSAMAQLFSYQYFWYTVPGVPPPTGLVALFSEPIGEAFVRFLNSRGIMSVWKESVGWRGSLDARQAGLCN